MQDMPTPVPQPEPPIKPIETVYAGCRFRSRLEARWAVFLDNLGLDWQYEPESFTVGGQPYLPDFWLPGLARWVEVKGALSQYDLGRINSATQELPRSPYGGPWVPDDQHGRILLLGEIPKTGGGSGACHRRFEHTPDGVQVRNFFFDETLAGEIYDCPIGEPGRMSPGVSAARVGPRWLADTCSPRLIVPERVELAYRAARMARFEHGESGTPQEVVRLTGAPPPRRRKTVVPLSPGTPQATSPTPVPTLVTQRKPRRSRKAPTPSALPVELN